MNKSQPNSEPVISIDLSPAEMVKLTKAAKQKNMTPVEYLLFLIEVSTHPEISSPFQL